jgi:RimJ/RimL family protein N-acetyltransferase
MPYHETFSPVNLIRCLRERRYPNLPAALFDRYLWFYKDLERVQYQLVYTTDKPICRLFELPGLDGSIHGIAHLEKTGNQLKVLIQTAYPDGLDEFIAMLKREYPLTRVTLTVEDQEIGTAVSRLLGWACKPRAIKLYTDQTGTPGHQPARELFAEDEELLAPLNPRPWPAYSGMLKLGYRFFGAINPEGRLISMAGLVPLTALRTEIIGVETFADTDRWQGYARAVCALALKAGLECTPTVTWSTTLDNPASVALAKSLGFKPIYSLYTLEGKWN